MRVRVLLVLVACACHPSSGASHAWGDVVVAKDARFEVVFDADARQHAPDDVPIRATFTHGGHAIDVGGFAREGHFVVRFSPRELGRWTWVVRAFDREVKEGSFVAVERALPSHGFIAIDARDHHRLAFEDGAPFWLLGENRINVYDPSWNFENASIEAYVARMARFGMTTLRVFVFNDCHSETAPDGHQLGCIEPSVGRFDEREAKNFDRIFDAAEKNGVYVVLVPFAVGFTPRPDTWKSWDDNPYSKLAKTPSEFFTNPQTRAAAERRLRYVIDRWGYSDHLLAIDLLNEPEWDGEIAESTWIPWAETMAKYVRSIDPNRHLVTTGSVGLTWNKGDVDERVWWANPENSMVQWHLYGKEFYEPHALAAEMTRKIDDTWGYDKPVFCGEFAYGGEDKTTYDHTHDGIWSALMSGAGALAHSAPQFEIDSDEPMTDARAAHFRVLATFVHEMDDWGDVQPRKDVTGNVDGVRVWSLRATDGRRALWVLGPKGNDVVANLSVSVPDLPAGDYRVAWHDDVTGAVIDMRAAKANAGEPTTLAVPTFSRHVAALVRRLP